jgi:hypothetical protein
MMTTNLPTVSHYMRAQKAAEILCHILVDEMRLQSPQRFLLTEHGKFVWLLAIMDDLHLGGSMAKYLQDGTLHRLSTALDGLPVYLSNHTGLRYAVLLSEKPKVPMHVDFPDALTECDVMPLGVGLTGIVNVQAKKLVNMIVVGAQDSGKSMALRALAHSARMHGSLLCLADPIAHTFSPSYWERASVLPIARNKGEFVTMLQALNVEIARRSVLFEQAAQNGIQPEDIDEYNRVVSVRMPRVWLIADEANSFLDSNAVKEALGDPARIGRKFGIHLVLAGHDWHEYTVPKGLSSYFETRLCLRTANDTAGKIVLDDHKRGRRTQNFRQPGRAVLRLRGQYQDLQLYFLSPERERVWFDEIQQAETVKWSMSELLEETQPAERVAALAASIRDRWTPEMSKRAVGRLLGIDYAGNYRKPVDQVIEFLIANTANSANGANNPDSGTLSPNPAVS